MKPTHTFDCWKIYIYKKVKLLIWFLYFHDSYFFSPYSLKVVFLVPMVYILILF